MKIAAAKAIASLVSDDELNPDYILPAAFDERVGKAVADAVAQAARDSVIAPARTRVRSFFIMLFFILVFLQYI